MGERFRHTHHHNHEGHANKVIGAGLIGLAIGAIAGMFFSPKSGSENRQDLANWMDDIKHDVDRKVRDAKFMTEEKYDEIIETASDKYRKLKSIKESELEDFVEDLKERWNRIKDEWNEQ